MTLMLADPPWTLFKNGCSSTPRWPRASSLSWPVSRQRRERCRPRRLQDRRLRVRAWKPNRTFARGSGSAGAIVPSSSGSAVRRADKASAWHTVLDLHACFRDRGSQRRARRRSCPLRGGDWREAAGSALSRRGSGSRPDRCRGPALARGNGPVETLSLAETKQSPSSFSPGAASKWGSIDGVLGAASRDAIRRHAGQIRYAGPMPYPTAELLSRLSSGQ